MVVVVAVEVDAAEERAADLLEIAVRRGVDGLLDLLLVRQRRRRARVLLGHLVLLNRTRVERVERVQVHQRLYNVVQ